MTNDSHKARLAALVQELSVIHEKVTLASGRESDFYVDMRRSTLHHEAAPLIGHVMLDLLEESGFSVGEEYVAVGGLTMGADPVATAMMHAAASRGLDLDAFVVRKAAKDHGMKRRIEGPDVVGKNVVVLEDTSTTGGSPLEAALALRHHAAVGEASVGAGLQELRAVVEELGGRDAGGDRGGRAGNRYEGGEAHVADAADHGQHRVVRRAVRLEDRVRAPALLGAVRAAEGDVDLRHREQVGEGGEDAGGVSVRDEERGIGARDVHAHAVDAADAHLAAAEALAADLAARPGLSLKVDVDGVGVDGGVVSRLDELEGQARLARVVEGVADALVVGVQPEHARHERAVRAVPAVGVREGVPQREAHAGDAAPHERGGHAGAAQGAGRMRRGGSHHDGAEHLEGRGRGEGLRLCCHGGSFRARGPARDAATAPGRRRRAPRRALFSAPSIPRPPRRVRPRAAPL